MLAKWRFPLLEKSSIVNKVIKTISQFIFLRKFLQHKNMQNKQFLLSWKYFCAKNCYFSLFFINLFFFQFLPKGLCNFSYFFVFVCRSENLIFKSIVFLNVPIYITKKQIKIIFIIINTIKSFCRDVFNLVNIKTKNPLK